MSLFDTNEKIDNAVALFRSLLDHGGWQLFTQIVDENIKVVTDQILHKPEGATEQDMDRLRDKLAVMEEMINTPEIMIAKFTQEDEKDVEVDPYDTVDTLTKRSADEALTSTS